MEQNEGTKRCIGTIVNDNIAIKKMRMIRKMNRQDAAAIFSYSRSSIERVENGRAKLSPDRVRKFVDGYGFTWPQFMDIKLGRKVDQSEILPEPKKVRIIEHVDLRRSYKRIITKEVRAIRTFRRRKGISQEKGSELCGYFKTTISHLENGRIDLTEEKIKHIMKCYGFSLHDFYECVGSDIPREEIEQDCIKLIQRLDDNRLLAVKGILEKF